jgi:hypothetical protein
MSVYTLILRIPKRPLLHGGFVMLSHCHTRRTLHDGTDAIFCNSSNDQKRASVGRRQRPSLLPPACACLRSYIIFFLAFSSFSFSFLLALLSSTSPLHLLRGRNSLTASFAAPALSPARPPATERVRLCTMHSSICLSLCPHL